MAFEDGFDHVKEAPPPTNPFLAEVLHDAQAATAGLIGGKVAKLEPPAQIDMKPNDWGTFAKGLDQSAKVSTPNFDHMLEHVGDSPATPAKESQDKQVHEHVANDAQGQHRNHDAQLQHNGAEAHRLSFEANAKPLDTHAPAKHLDMNAHHPQLAFHEPKHNRSAA
jgi:hypothetical protein